MIIMKNGHPTSRSAPFPSFPLFSAEAVLAYAAEWAYPVLRYIFPCCSWSNSIIRIAYSRIINVTANITYILIHSISSSSVRFQNLFALISINHKAYILRSLSAPVSLINSTINRFLNLYYIIISCCFHWHRFRRDTQEQLVFVTRGPRSRYSVHWNC